MTYFFTAAIIGYDIGMGGWLLYSVINDKVQEYKRKKAYHKWVAMGKPRLDCTYYSWGCAPISRGYGTQETITEETA